MVTFMNGATAIGSAALSSGSASITFSFGTANTYSLTAVYAGDANYNGSTSAAVNEVVELAPTSTALSSGTNPSISGNSVTFTATVTTPFGKPAGNVTFSATGPAPVTSSSGALNTSGQATGSLLFTVAGIYDVTASYPGDTDHAASASIALSQVVNCPTCTATTTSIGTVTVTATDPGEPANTVRFQQSVSFTVTVTAGSGSAAPTGSVQLQDNGVDLSSPQSLTPGVGTSATASFTLNRLGPSPHSLVAIYGGTSTTFGGSLSTPVVLNNLAQDENARKPH
jgi:hypothetical protein